MTASNGVQKYPIIDLWWGISGHMWGNFRPRKGSLENRIHVCFKYTYKCSDNKNCEVTCILHTEKKIEIQKWGNSGHHFLGFLQRHIFFR